MPAVSTGDKLGGVCDVFPDESENLPSTGDCGGELGRALIGYEKLIDVLLPGRSSSGEVPFGAVRGLAGLAVIL